MFEANYCGWIFEGLYMVGLRANIMARCLCANSMVGDERDNNKA